MQGTGSWWYILLGILMLLMALQTWELFNFLPATHAISKSKSKGFLGAFLAGILGGLFSSPCSTPVLIALLAIVAREGDILRGIFLLLLYSIGHSVLVMIAGTSIGFVKKLSSSGKYGKASTVLRIIMGALILLVAFYMFYLGF
jgi:cytochrome c biogenesis protein CcdA